MVGLREAAQIIGVHEHTVRNWMLAGRLVGYRVGPKILRFRRADVEALAQGEAVS